MSQLQSSIQKLLVPHAKARLSEVQAEVEELQQFLRTYDSPQEVVVDPPVRVTASPVRRKKRQRPAPSAGTHAAKKRTLTDEERAVISEKMREHWVKRRAAKRQQALQAASAQEASA